MKLKPFQKQDYARLALTDGAILAHDPGLGKTWSAYTWSFLKVGFEVSGANLIPKAPVLIVEPGDLHQQFIDEGKRVFRAVVTPLDSQATFLRLSHLDPVSGRRILPPGFYITSYTQLGVNGVPHLPKLTTDNPFELLTFLNLSREDVAALYDGGAIPADREGHYARLGVSRFALQAEVNAAYNSWLATVDEEQLRSPSAQRMTRAHAVLSDTKTRSKYDSGKPPIPFANQPEPEQKAIMLDYGCHKVSGLTENLGEWRYPGRDYTVRGELVGPVPGEQSSIYPVKCTHAPTLADLCQQTFTAVVVDEATRMKGDDALIANAIRQLQPPFRLILTATPIKNRVPDIFWLAWWATGGHPLGHARWPYASSDKEEFASTFCVSERNLTKEAAARAAGKSGRNRFRKLTPQVCNVHRLWKLLAPIVLRRRKKAIGEFDSNEPAIVPKNIHVYRVPMGKTQADVYKQHLDWHPKDKHGRSAIGVQLQALRIVATNPGSPLAPRARGYSYIPKTAACLTLVEQILRRREQAIIFSPFHDPLDVLSARLNDAGVIHAVLDGRVSQRERGRLAARFKAGPPQYSGHRKDLSYLPILLAGIECMAEGHSFHLCNNQILLSYPWALDKVLQAEDRAHRLNSVKALNVYRLICHGSIDRKMESQIDEKGDAAEMVLDGHLLGENPAELNLAELLDIAAKEFAEGAEAIDETVLEAEWPVLRGRLAQAYQFWMTPETIPAMTTPAAGWRAHYLSRRRLAIAA